MQYQIIKQLSSSAQGAVWLIEFSDGKNAVLRIYKYNESLYSMFSRLKHIECQYIPRVYSVEHSDDSIEIIEEYINGMSLAAVMSSGRFFTTAEVHSIGLVLCKALERLHSNNIIHRDIKPSNIMLTNEGKIKLIDFNAARFYNGNQSKDTRLLGTEGYAAPEQYGFSETDFRADIYSVGVTLKELCKGKVGSLKRAINGCTEFDPNKRYKTVKELRKDIAFPYRRVIIGSIISTALIVGMVLLFVLVDVPKTLSELTGKAVYDADMTLPVTVEYMLNDYGNEFFADGEGKVKFHFGQPLDNDYGILLTHPDAQFVDFTTPNTALIFRISKENNAVINNLKITFDMHGIYLKNHGNSSESVELTNHINGIGMYGGAVWTCNTALSEEKFMLDFKNAVVFGDESYISVTVSADGFKNKTFEIAVSKPDVPFYPFSSPENFEYIFDCEPLVGKHLSILTMGMGNDYVESEYNENNRLITYDSINVGFVVNNNNIIIGLLGKKGVRLSAFSEIGMTFNELKQGLASLVWTDEIIIMDEKELRVAIAYIGGIDYRVYFYDNISLLVEL